MAAHAMATRKGGSLVPMKRLTILAGPEPAKRIDEICMQFDVASFVSQEGFGRTSFTTTSRSVPTNDETQSRASSKYYRIEVVCSLNTSDQIVSAIRNELPDDESATVYIEAIHLMRRMAPVASNPSE